MKKIFYQEKLEEEKIKLATYHKQSSRLSLLRLIIFIVVIVSLSLAFFDHKTFLYFVAIASLILFMYLLQYHSKIIQEEKFIKSKIEILNRYLDRFEHRWQSFENRGDQFKEGAPFIAVDLDIIGKNSLFQYMNLARSTTGQKALYDRLVYSKDYSADSLAISELANKKELHLKLTSLINQYDGKKSNLILNDEKYLSKSSSLLYNFVGNIYPFLSCIIIILLIFNILPSQYLSLLIAINLIIFVIGFLKNNRFLSSLLNHNQNLIVLTQVIKELESAKFESNKLISVQESLRTNLSATQVLKKMTSLVDRVKSRENILIYLLANIFIMWDYRSVYLYDSWKKNTGKQANKYLEYLFEIEVLLSLGVIEQTKEVVSKPVISLKEQPYFEIEGVYHPLLNYEGVVKNDFNSSNKPMIITGSNMSGKTTLIRSIGINHILAFAGASVCAKRMETTYMHILTSIRVQDDFNEGISTFYAEINRIKEMIDYLKTNKPLLVLIDEIFKGTNSYDRIYGAKKAIESLNKPQVLAIITTHDSQLCDLENVINYHFKEYYENDKIMFEYLINEGQSQTRNARYLLKLAGITNE